MNAYGVLRLTGGLLVVLAAASSATATQISWTYQTIDSQTTMTKTGLALALADGVSFPRVFYAGSQQYPQRMIGASLRPAGWKQHAFSPLLTESYVRARPGHDGRVGAAWKDGQIIRFAQYADQGWQTATLGVSTAGPAGNNAPDLAYTSRDQAVLAYSEGGKVRVATYDNGGWNIETPDTGDGLGVSGSFASVAVDSQDRISVAFLGLNTLRFACQDPVRGTWGVTTPLEGVLPRYRISLAFNPNDVPGIAYLTTGRNLWYAWFDPVSGSWQSEQVATAMQSEVVNLVFNRQGHPALAYVGSDGMVHYQINDGDGWANVVLSEFAPITQSPAALAFDDQDLPVISYYAQGGGLVLAYDPIIAPEPASALLIVAGATLAIRRRIRYA